MISRPEQPLPFDLGAISSAVGGLASAKDFDASWHARSFANPEGFYASLMQRLEGESGVRLQSELGMRYDFFHDLCERFRRTSRRLQALRWTDPGGDALQVDFELLGKQATRIHAYWLTQGVAPGEIVCVIADPGPEYAVAVLAALRSGLQVACIPPHGAAFVQHRVAALTPDYIVVDRLFEPWLGAFADRVLPLMDPQFKAPTIAPSAHRYGADDPALQLFSPYAPSSEMPCELSAHGLYTGLLRDAGLILPVQPGERVAAPGFDPVVMHPWLMLVTWFGGGEYAFLDLAQVTQNPRRLVEARPSLLGVTPELRDLLLESRELAALEVGRWFRDPAQPADFTRWDDFSKALAPQGARGFNLLASAACGGSLLFSRKQERPELFSVMPSPGQAWSLEDTNGSGEPAIGSVGIFRPQGELMDGRAGQFLLSENQDHYQLLGSLDAWRAGVRYPSAEVSRLLVHHAIADCATAVMLPATHQVNHSEALLIVFVDPRAAEEVERSRSTLTHHIRGLIERELGAWALPQQIHLLPLLPHLDDQGAVDSDWARRQVLGNVLFHKARRAVFVELAALKRTLALLGAEPAALPSMEPGQESRRP